jgi:hypothetical protein
MKKKAMRKLCAFLLGALLMMGTGLSDGALAKTIGLRHIRDFEMVYGGVNIFAWIEGVEAYECTSIPFLFRDYAHMKMSLESDFFKPIMEKAEKDTRIKVVAINGDTTPRGLSTRDRPVRTAADFSRFKIRTAACHSGTR